MKERTWSMKGLDLRALRLDGSETGRILGWDAKNLRCKIQYRVVEYVYDHFFHESRRWSLVKGLIKRQNRP